jgi:hypothetical protein
MKKLIHIYFIFISTLISMSSAFAAAPQFTKYPDGSLMAPGNSTTLIGILSLIQ